MAFRYAGFNWENRKFRTVGAITRLGQQIEVLRPGYFVIDGTVASRAHDMVSPSSDHSPDVDGDVRAIDFGGWHSWLAETAEALRLSQDPRIKYVIHNGRLFSSYPRGGYDPFEWRPYGGTNPHRSHVHLSVLTGSLEEDKSAWVLEEDELAQFTEDEAKELRDLVNALKRKESSGWGLGTQATDLVRRERATPLHDPVEGAVDETARLGVAANANQVRDLKEILRSV